MNAEPFLFSDLAGVAGTLANRHPAVVRDILVSIEDDDTVRELVADGVAGLVSSPAEPEAWMDDLASVLMEGRLRAEGGALGDHERERWMRCFSTGLEAFNL